MTGGPSVVIVGGGQAGFQTAASLREFGWSGSITLIAEENLPYQRPPLSKAFLHGDAGVESLLLRPDDYFVRHSITVEHARAAAVDRVARTVRTSIGTRRSYDHLVFATGCRARALTLPGIDLRGVLSLRTVADAHRLADQLGSARRLVIVGGGFIGLEVAAAASRRGVATTVLEVAGQLMGRAVSGPIATYFAQRHRAAGTTVHLNTEVAALIGGDAGQVTAVETSAGEVLAADVVVVGVGAVPNTELAEQCGLRVDNGVVVDHYLRSPSDPSISAVGDCSRFTAAGTDALTRLESVQNAVDQARCAAANIAGSRRVFDVVPWFWTDQLGLKLQIAGLTPGADDTVVVGDVAAAKFSVYCFAGGRLLGVESINHPSDHLAARRFLARPPAYRQALTPAVVGRPGFVLKTFLG